MSTKKIIYTSILISSLFILGCGDEKTAGITPQTMADALHAVMEADRTVYTQQVVNRLVKEDEVIKASEHWQDEKALPLPAQMFRMGAEHVTRNNANFSYALISPWPINKKNEARTEVEKLGLRKIVDAGSGNYYSEETLGDIKYFTAIYPDVAVAEACISCHNEHKDSPRSDFELDDVMGGVVIRIPIQ